MYQVRIAFQDWWEEWFGEAPLTPWDELWCGEGYSAEDIDHMWEAWQASRAAIEIELPELEKWRSVEPVRAQITYRSMTKDRLIAAGLAVKGDR